MADMQRLKVYQLGKPIDRTDDLWQRIVDAIVTVLGQAKVIRVRWPGLAHGAFFWSFVVLFIGTSLIVLQADFTDLLFDIKFLKGTFYKMFSISLDIAGLVALLGMGALFVRRYLLQSATLESTWNDAFMHGLLFLILLTGFVIEGARMAVTELGTPLAYWSPVGLVFAKAMSGIGETGLQQLHVSTWWFHLLLVMVFIISIPFTKFRHHRHHCRRTWSSRIADRSANCRPSNWKTKRRRALARSSLPISAGRISSIPMPVSNASAVRTGVRPTPPTSRCRR